MTLAFMTTFPKTLERIGGQPTNFVEKIVSGFMRKKICNEEEEYKMWSSCYDKKLIPLNVSSLYKPKLHTFREDPHDRIKLGTLLHMVINNRTPQRFQFVPTIPCVSTQRVEIRHFVDFTSVTIDKKNLKEGQIQALAQNDGFDSVADFFAYFNKDWKGKIIHWTDLKY